MSNRTSVSSRLRSSVDPVSVLRRLGKALDINVPELPQDIVSMPFPDVNDVQFRDKYLLKEIFRKYPGFDLGIDTRSVSLDCFFQQEMINKETNERLLSLNASANTDVASVFYRAARKSVKVLGRFDWSLFRDGLRFGPNSTTRLPKRKSGVYEKLSGRPHVTPAASRLAYAVMCDAPNWVFDVTREVSPSKCLTLRSSDRLVCVPKNAKTDRTIAIQPDMNVMLQLAVAYVMRHRLKRWGIDLNHQSINQRRAKSASLLGDLATIDLSNASNSMSCSLVWKMIGDHPYIGQICGPLWYTLFEILRTERGEIENRTVEYELFSAMGNGYTFELESLIFWAIAHETCAFLGLSPDVSVYGDDIILPTKAVSLFREVLSYAGFSFNSEKSFWNDRESGPTNLFRESCGKHYRNGQDVTPVYVTKSLDTVEELVLLINNLMRWAKLPYGLDGRLRPVVNWLIDQLPPWAKNTCIPFGESNDGLIKNQDACCPAVAYQANDSTLTQVPKYCGIGRGSRLTFIGYRCTVFKKYSRSTKVEGRSRLTSWLYLKSFKVFRPPSESGRFEVGEPLAINRPSLKERTVIGRRVTTSWDDPGPWIV